MTLYDAAMIGLVIGGMIWGAWRGIVWQLASIVSLVLGYTVAHTLSDDLAIHFPGDPLVARGLAMVVIYACVSGVVFFAAWMVRATLRKLQFEAYDRHLGMVLGGIEGALLGMVATLFVVSLAPASRGPIFKSRSGKVVGTVMNALGPILPTEARDVLKPFFEGGSTAEVAESRPDPVGVESPLDDPRPSEAEGRNRTTDDRKSASKPRRPSLGRTKF